MIAVSFSCDYYYYCQTDCSGQGLKVTCGPGTLGCVGGAGRWSLSLGAELLLLAASFLAVRSLCGHRMVLVSTWWWCCCLPLLFRPRSFGLSIIGSWIELWTTVPLCLEISAGACESSSAGFHSEGSWGYSFTRLPSLHYAF